MVSQKITINNPSGLHLRPAGNLCNEAIKYQSLITFTYEGEQPMQRVCSAYWVPA